MELMVPPPKTFYNILSIWAGRYVQKHLNVDNDYLWIKDSLVMKSLAILCDG